MRQSMLQTGYSTISIGLIVILVISLHLEEVDCSHGGP